MAGMFNEKRTFFENYLLTMDLHRFSLIYNHRFLRVRRDYFLEKEKGSWYSTNTELFSAVREEDS